MNVTRVEKIVKILTIGIAVYLLCFGIAMVYFPIKPFWNDEWRLIYNLKFKNVHQLWGTLDLLQQCPRVYLTLLKEITSSFDYNYISLRLPALVITAVNILFIFNLQKKLLPGKRIYGYLFVLIVVSSQTFTDYMTQVKQYEMDIFLCLLVLWQLTTLLEVCTQERINNGKYLLLCFSFLVAPFFSYIYPIAVAPVFPVILLGSFTALKSRQQNKAQFMLSVFVPLAIVCASIFVFYLIDVKQLMSDNRMYLSYIKMMGREKNANPFLENFWKLFALVVSGALFEIIFGTLGIGAFFYIIYRLVRTKRVNYTKEDYLKLYAVSLLVLTIGLFASGKLMGGVPRLVVFTVPSIALLIVFLLEDIKTMYGYIKISAIVTAILFLGLIGNIASTCPNVFTHYMYNTKMRAYQTTSLALIEARRNKIPILITEEIRADELHDPNLVPGKLYTNTITPDQIAGNDILCPEVVLKVNPEYKVWDPIPVYTIPDMKSPQEYMNQLPQEYKSAIICDGLTFIKLTR